jgi:hypothetical protein
MVALGLSTSLGGILSGCRHARLHPRQIVESGRATMAGVMGCPKSVQPWRLVVVKCVEARGCPKSVY